MDEEKTLSGILKKYKNSGDVVLEGELIRNYSKKFQFIFISTGKLYILDLQVSFLIFFLIYFFLRKINS